MPVRPRTLPGWFDLGVLFALAALVYLPAISRAEFLNFDDPFFFGDGAFDGGLAQVWNPTATIANAYLPVSHTSLWIDFQLAGGDATWPRVHSMLLHFLAAFALARLFGRLGVGRVAATAGAALFAVHPALVESAAWLASRKDLLSGLFVLLSLSAAQRSWQGDRRQRWFAVAWALLALYSKATAVVLPLLAALILWRKPRQIGLLVALTAITIGAGLHHTWIASTEGTLVTTGLAARGSQVPGAFWHYFATTFWPVGLNVMYPEVETFEQFRAIAWPAGLALALAVGALIALHRKLPWVAVGLFAWALALAPFNTAFPASASAAADRYLYLAIPGAIFAVLGLGRRVGPIVAAAAIVPCAFLAADRARDFQNSETLWNSSLDQNPRNAVALFNLATDGMRRHPADFDRPEELLRAAEQHARYPQHALRASMLLVGVTEASGRIEESVEHARAAVATLDELPNAGAALHRDVLLKASRQARYGGAPELADGWIARASAIDPADPEVLAFQASARLGELLDAAGRVASTEPGLDAVRDLLARAERSPIAARVYGLPLAQAELAAATGEFMAAEKYYNRAIALIPHRPEAHLGRAQVYLGRGIYKGAENAVRDAFELKVPDPRLKYLFGLALGGQGKLDQARRYYEAYLLGRPHDKAARRALAAVVAGQTMRDLHRLEPHRLAQIADRVLELDPESPKGFVIRGVAKRHDRDMQAALVLFERARGMLEGDADVDRLWVETLRDRGYQLLLADERRDAAFDHFRRFLDHAGRVNLPTDAVGNLVGEEWLRQFTAGQEAILQDDLDGAELALRRCLELRPDEPQPRFQLGLALFKRGGDALQDALEQFKAHVAGQVERESDPSLGILYQVLTLARLDRNADAIGIADAFLAAPDSVAAPATVARVRAARAQLDR